MRTFSPGILMLLGQLSLALPCNAQPVTTATYTPKNTGAMKQAEEKDKVVTGYSLVNGMKMYYEIHGAGKPLVLLHGGGSTIQTTFGRILETIAQSHQVIAVELQAHGHTPDRGRPSSFEQDADDVAALLKNLNIARADIFGFSNGGTTALQIAIRHPQLVDKLVVTSAICKKSGAIPFLWKLIDTGTFEDMPQAYKDAFLAINPNKKDLLTMYERDAARMRSFKDIPDKDMAAIQSKTLILIGDKDVPTPAHAVEMQQLIPNARLMIIPGGHGDFIGEITTLKPGNDSYLHVVSLIEDFLSVK